MPKLRNRMVVFRLTQEEYDHLKGVCEERGGRNLSDFTRSELMTFLGADSLERLLEKRFFDVKQQLGELRDAVRQLSILVHHGPQPTDPT